MPEPIEESVEVQPSADNGNIPADAPSPELDKPTETKEPIAAVEPELYDLPDGRKVDAETLSKEWKENFYPDYTRKSQALAAKEKLTTEKPVDPTSDPEWQPQSYSELLEVAEKRALEKVEAKEQARIENHKAIENAVIAELADLKKGDPNLNENALFLHANKYGFRDLKTAHQNMKDMNLLAKTVKQATAKDIAKRNDPVSIAPGANGNKTNPSNFGTAVEYLRSLK